MSTENMMLLIGLALYGLGMLGSNWRIATIGLLLISLR